MSRLIVSHPVLITLLLLLTFGFSVQHRVIASPPQQTDEDVPVIQFWHPYAGERETAINALIDRFNDEHREQFQVEGRAFQDGGFLYDQIILQLTGGQQLPQLALVWPFEAAIFDLSGRVQDASAILEDTSPDTFTIDPTTISTDPITGKMLGVPLHLHMHTLFVNLDALNELDMGDIPTDFADMADAACAFQEANGWPGVERLIPEGWPVERPTFGVETELGPVFPSLTDQVNRVELCSVGMY